MRFVVVCLRLDVKNRSESENMHGENERQAKELVQNAGKGLK